MITKDYGHDLGLGLGCTKMILFGIIVTQIKLWKKCKKILCMI